jgi:hypothetical protein
VRVSPTLKQQDRSTQQDMQNNQIALLCSEIGQQGMG